MEPESKSPVNAFTTEIIAFFVNAVKVLGLPRSIGEIFGLLFASARALSFEEIMRQLRQSKGSTSQGLKVLRSLGMVKPVYIAGERRDFFTAETDLRYLVSGLIREQFMPQLTGAASVLERAEHHLTDISEDQQPEFRVRLEKLRHWHSRARALFPVIQEFFN